MTSEDVDPPVADDDFPEFAQPPRHRPPESRPPEDRVPESRAPERRAPRRPSDHAPDEGPRPARDQAPPAPSDAGDDAQARADEIFARLRREREQGKR